MSDKHIDEFSGVATTGHEWDGIKELNNPLPRWWVWTFYGTIVWALAYTIAYPAWPLISSATTGMLGYSSRVEVRKELDAAEAAKSDYVAAVKAKSVTEIEADDQLRAFATAAGAAAFKVNCIQCHGSGAAGSAGYPNLNDDDWLWGGTPEAIERTIQHGIRSGDPEAREMQMPRFGIDGMLKPAEITDAAQFVLSLSGKSTDPAAAERGKQIFADNCVACHGPEGKGNQDVGAPNLTDGIWLYGGKLADIEKTIETGRGGVMPYWTGRLDPVTIKMLAAYVHSLGGGK